MKAYKGFDKDMKCRGFQFEEGKEYEEDTAELCVSGFHACTMPLEVLRYYPAADGSIYREVELDEVSDQREDDSSKVCAKKIKIGAELDIPGLVKAQIEWGKETSGRDVQEESTGSQGVSVATGYRGASVATGSQGVSVATGDRGAASATGSRGASVATGDRGASVATGYRGNSVATGDQGASVATGDRGASVATGSRGASVATGDRGAASATGSHGAALAAGKGCRVMGALGCAIFGVERGNWDGKSYPIISVASAIVDGKSIKPDVWYTVKDGHFVEVGG